MEVAPLGVLDNTMIEVKPIKKNTLPRTLTWAKV